MKTHTKGNVIVENIKIGDIHYEYEYNLGIKCIVLTLPEKDSNGGWFWDSKNLITEKTINYYVDPKYPHYAANLYDYEAYSVKNYI